MMKKVRKVSLFILKIGKIFPPIPQETISITVTAVAAISLGLSILSSVFGGSSPQSMFSVLNQLQIFLLFPLLNFYLSKAVLDFYESLTWALGSIGFADLVGFNKDNFNRKIFKPFLEEQDDEKLKILGIEYKSTLTNLLPVFSMVLLLILYKII